MFQLVDTTGQRLTLVALLLALLAANEPLSASVTTTIDFETLPNGAAVEHGDIISNQFDSLGVTIRARNLSDGPDLALAFDTNLNNTADPDLERPFTSGNLADGTLPTVRSDNIELGNVVIIQENDNGPPDDEGSRPAGNIILDFSTPITSFGFDVIDVERTEIYGPPPASGKFRDRRGYYVTFFTENDAGDLVRLRRINFNEFLRASDRTDGGTVDGRLSNQSEGDVKFNGDNSANRIDPITVEDLRMFTGNNSIEDFTRVVIRFGGSGAIDNVSFASAAAVPEATALATWLLLGCCASRSRRRA